MLINKIKNSQGTKLHLESLLIVIKDLKAVYTKAGYITDVEMKNGSSIKVGLRGKHFVLDLTQHSYNLAHSPYKVKRTCLPAWEQRVEFNDLTNAVLSRHGLSCNVKSGPYIIREGTVKFNENDWYDQTPNWIRQNQSRGWYVELMNSGSMAEFMEERRLERNRISREKRAEKKRQEEFPQLSLVK